VTAPDRQDRPKGGKNDDLDAQNAAHRTVTPRSRDGMIEALRVLVACRKTAVMARRQTEPALLRGYESKAYFKKNVDLTDRKSKDG